VSALISAGLLIVKWRFSFITWCWIRGHSITWV